MGQKRTKSVCGDDVGFTPTSGGQNALVDGNQGATLGKPRLVQQKSPKRSMSRARLETLGDDS